MSSFSNHIIITTTLYLLEQLGYKSTLAFLGAEVLYIAKPNKQFTWLSTHKDYLHINAFLNQVVVE